MPEAQLTEPLDRAAEKGGLEDLFAALEGKRRSRPTSAYATAYRTSARCRSVRYTVQPLAAVRSRVDGVLDVAGDPERVRFRSTNAGHSCSKDVCSAPVAMPVAAGTMNARRDPFPGHDGLHWSICREVDDTQAGRNSRIAAAEGLGSLSSPSGAELGSRIRRTGVKRGFLNWGQGDVALFSTVQCHVALIRRIQPSRREKYWGERRRNRGRSPSYLLFVVLFDR